VRQTSIVANKRATACSNLEHEFGPRKPHFLIDTSDIMILWNFLRPRHPSQYSNPPGKLPECFPNPMFASSMFTGSSSSPSAERPLASLELFSTAFRFCIRTQPFCSLRSGYSLPRNYLLSLPIASLCTLPRHPHSHARNNGPARRDPRLQLHLATGAASEHMARRSRMLFVYTRLFTCTTGS
jgi:hypothetical protein